MRSFLVLALLAGCELQPPPPHREPPPAATPPTAVPAAAPADAAPPAPTDAKAQVQVSDRCLEVGVHVADTLINTADEAQKSVFANERERIVRATAEACTTQAWNEPAAKCYIAARTQADLKACEKKYTPPQPPTPVGPTLNVGKTSDAPGDKRVEPTK